MDFIVSEFINLIKRCSNGLTLEKEIWRRGIELQCRDFAQALETYDAEMARQYAENRKYCGSTGVLCLACSGRSHSPAVWSGAKAESHSILWIISWACHLINGILRCSCTQEPKWQPAASIGLPLRL